MLIIIISFIIQLSIISSLIGNYSDNAKNLEITRAALAFSSFIEKMYNDSSVYNTFEKFCDMKPVTMSSSLTIMLKYANDMSFLVTNTDGVILFNKGDGIPQDIDKSIRVSSGIINKIKKDSYYLYVPSKDDPYSVRICLSAALQ